MSRETKINPVFNVINGLSRAAWLVAAAALVILVLMFGWGVFARYVLRAVPMWYGELPVDMQIVMAFLGMAYVLKEEKHITIGLLTERLTVHTRNWLRFVTSIFGFFFCAMLVYYSYDMTVSAITISQKSMTLLLPTYPLKIITGLGFLLFGLQFIVRANHYLVLARGGDKEGADE